MTTKQFLDSIEKSYTDALEIVKKKNHDYATEIDPWRNFRYADYCGVSVERAILVRISDKFARLCNLVDSEDVAVKDETVMDTILDMANYLVILKAYLEDNES
jgi:hypothetical protein